jgi:hypothetical protein
MDATVVARDKNAIFSVKKSWGKVIVATNLGYNGGFALQGKFLNVNTRVENNGAELHAWIEDADSWHPYPVMICVEFTASPANYNSFSLPGLGKSEETFVAVFSPHDKNYSASQFQAFVHKYNITNTAGYDSFGKYTLSSTGKVQFILDYHSSVGIVGSVDVDNALSKAKFYPPGIVSRGKTTNHNYAATMLIELMRIEGKFQMLNPPIKGQKEDIDKEVAKILGTKWKRKSGSSTASSKNYQRQFSIKRNRKKMVAVGSNDIKSVSLPDDKYGFVMKDKKTHGIELLVDDYGVISLMDVLSGRENLSEGLKELLVEQAKLLESAAMAYRLIAYEPDDNSE